MIKKNIFSLLSLLCLIIILIQLFIFLIIEISYPYKYNDSFHFNQKSYFTYIISFTTLFLIFKYFLNKNYFDNKIIKITLDEFLFKKLKIIVNLVTLGIIFTIISKYILYSEYLTQKSESVCFVQLVRIGWEINRALLEHDQIKLFLYNILSPLGVFLINFLFLIQIVIFLNKKINIRSGYFVFFLFALFVYYISNFRSNILLIILFFTLSLFILNICLFKTINYKKSIYTIFFIVLLILTSFYERSKCGLTANHEKEIERRCDINFIKCTPNFTKKDNSSNFLNLIRSIYTYDNNFSKALNHIYIYLISGKYNGELLIDHISYKKKNLHLYLKKHLNLPIVDFNRFTSEKKKLEKYKTLSLIEPKLQFTRGSVSTYGLLYYDYKYLAGLIFYIFHTLPIILFIYFKKLKIVNNQNYHFLLFIGILNFVFSLVGSIIAIPNEILNSRFIFYNLFFWYMFLIVKKRFKDL